MHAVRQRGLALVAVLWMVAALTLLASSVIFATRGEIRSVQQLSDATRAAALGDAAVHLAILDLRDDRRGAAERQQRTYVLDGRDVTVTVVPAAGLVNLNKADKGLLTSLFVYAGDLDEAGAAVLAERVVERRGSNRRARLRGSRRARSEGQQMSIREARFDVVEDLMQVEGFDFDLFERVRDLVTVNSPGGGVHAASAPPALIDVLASGDAQAADAYLARRESDDPGVDTTDLEYVNPRGSRGGVYRLDADVPTAGGGAGALRRSVWVDLSGRGGRLPFKWLDAARPRAVPAKGG
jgi:general secretion pathway protein K